MSIYAFGQGLNNGLQTGAQFAQLQDQRDHYHAVQNLERERLGLIADQQRFNFGLQQYKVASNEHQQQMGVLFNSRAQAQQAGDTEAVKLFDQSLLEGINRTPRLQQWINQGAPAGGRKALTHFKTTGDGRFAIGVDTFDKNNKKISSAYLSQQRSSDPNDPYVTADKEGVFKFLHDNPDTAPYIIQSFYEKQTPTIKDRLAIYKAADEHATSYVEANAGQVDSITKKPVPDNVLYQQAHTAFLTQFGLGSHKARDPLSGFLGGNKTSGSPPPLPPEAPDLSVNARALDERLNRSILGSGLQQQMKQRPKNPFVSSDLMSSPAFEYSKHNPLGLTY